MQPMQGYGMQQPMQPMYSGAPAGFTTGGLSAGFGGGYTPAFASAPAGGDFFSAGRSGVGTGFGLSPYPGMGAAGYGGAASGPYTFTPSPAGYGAGVGGGVNAPDPFAGFQLSAPSTNYTPRQPDNQHGASPKKAQVSQAYAAPQFMGAAPPPIMGATAAEPDPDDDPNRLPTFVKVRGLPAEHDPRIVRRKGGKKRAPGVCCA